MRPRGFYKIAPQKVFNQDKSEDDELVHKGTLSVQPQSPTAYEKNVLPKKRNGYLFEKELGQGSFGTVYLASKGNAEYAIKVINGDKSTDLKREVNNLRHLSAYPECNRYIVCYHSSFGLMEMGKSCLYIVTEYLPGETLQEYMQNTCKQKTHIAMQLLHGLSVIHNRGYAHRDVKPTNIIVSPNGNVKYIDFGFACHGSCLGKPGTPLYNPPEYYNGECNTGLWAAQAHDVWSLGVVLYQLLMGVRNYPFLDLGNKEQLIREIVERAPAYPPHFHLFKNSLKRVVQCMLVADWKDRPCIDDVVYAFSADIISLL